jgi:uncharacterized protein
LRIVVLALQDRLAYGPTFESAMASLFGSAAPAAAASATPGVQAPATPPRGTAEAPGDFESLIAGAAKDLAEYQRLTAEGKLGEAGQKLEALKQKLDQAQRSRR